MLKIMIHSKCIIMFCFPKPGHKLRKFALSTLPKKSSNDVFMIQRFSEQHAGDVV